MSTVTPSLALPSGDRELPARALVLGHLAAGAAGFALIGALCGAYLGLRAGAAEWLPAEFEIDGFLGVMLTLTAFMSAPFAFWAVIADGRGLRRQASTALSLTAFIGLCLLNGVWYLGTQLELGATSSVYATVSYALLGAISAFLAGGLIALFVALAKVGGRQTGPGHVGLVQGAAWLWMIALLGWIAVWSILFLVK